jgi:hypothetical protein
MLILIKRLHKHLTQDSLRCLSTLPPAGGYNSEDEDENLFKDIENGLLNRDDVEVCHVYSILKTGKLTIFGAS